MISRRLLRIKAIQMLYAYHESDSPSLAKFEKELFFSIDKVYHLYHSLLQLITDVSDLAGEKMEISKNKFLPTKEELNPITKFIDNKIIRQITSNRQLAHYIHENKITWGQHPELTRKIFQTIKDSEEYTAYLQNVETSYKQDKAFVIFIYQSIIAECGLLYEILEEQSIYWNDDVEFVISMIIQTIDKFKESDNEFARLLPLFKNEEDVDFIKTLFRKAIIKHDEHKELIDKYTKNWDVERIAFMDIILMELAITEITEITSVPTKVSFNEYIEISKFYSTSKSSTFINGVLDKIIQHLKEENKITKTGRGLIGEK